MHHQQIELCPAHPTGTPEYHVIEILGEVVQRGDSMQESTLADWSLVDSCGAHYQAAVDLARHHCLQSGHEVWVLDRHDGDYIAMRVHPSEYARRAVVWR